MFKNSISLKSLLETHQLPFVIIDASLTIVGINKAWETSLNVSKEESIGQPCCNHTPNCRHFKLFQTLEPYTSQEILNKETRLSIRGYPLLDNNGTVYLGESITQSTAILDAKECSKMVGSSQVFIEYKSRLLQAAKTQASILLTGETGTGKELAAGFIHAHSKQQKHDLVIVDCTVLSEDLFESELFGHEKGAFTGATHAKKGLFELADQGTLFLDEIGDLPLSQQPKLLRALETGQFRRVGSTKSLKSNVRIICATHRNLTEMVKQGLFRADLYYRLAVFPIQIPSLRARLQDIPDLSHYLLTQLGRQDNHKYSLDKTALIKLIQHQWPGNIRELKNCLQLACSICHNNQITEQDITYIPYQALDSKPYLLNDSDIISPANPLIQMESEVIKALIKKHQGNRKLIAAEMDISERTLYRKLKRFELN